tara:strand:+ start:274 stop:438 length:165 start_codon:yes stop_codon:yes gene_type:complete
MDTVVTTFDKHHTILAKYIFQSFDEACDFVGNYDLKTGNIRNEDIQRIIIEEEV